MIRFNKTYQKRSALKWKKNHLPFVNVMKHFFQSEMHFIPCLLFDKQTETFWFLSDPKQLE